MEDVKIGKGSISFWGCAAAFGSVLVILGFFLAITKINGLSLTGWELLRGKSDGTDISKWLTFWRYIPLITMIIGVAAIVFEALPMLGKDGLKPVAMGLAIASLVLAVLVLACTAGSPGFKDMPHKTEYVRAIGSYFMLYGGIIATVCSVLDLKGVKSPL